MKKYVKWKTHKRGIPNSDGGARLCMHCGRKATVSAVSRTKGTSLVMDVIFCDEHAEYARGL